MNPLNDVEIGETLLLSIIKGVATYMVRTEYGILTYKKNINQILN